MEENKVLNDVLQLPCPSCGSHLHYSAQHKRISCEYCGYKEEIDNSSDEVVEQSLSEAALHVKNFEPEEVGKKVFDCQNCGARFMVESDQMKVNCGFCGSRNVNVEALKHQLIQPVGIIPFYVSRDEAEEHFHKWIRKGWFHPSKLRRLASIENLHGIYIPFWTYDAQTESDWEGEAGYYYYETQRVRVNGQMQNKQVRKVRWRYSSGHLDHFFDDVLVVASGGMEQKEVERILPFRLEEVVNFDPRLMIGWESEIYSLEVDDGYQRAEDIMDYKIRHMCSAQLGGDTQRNLRVRSQKYDQTFKHIILPIWISSYNYHEKTFRFCINGQTGRVYGKKPVSWLKIVILVLIFGLFILSIYLLRESGVLS
ncbi:MAG: hypothetical protein GY705_14055 [Bacteroidetes bacterium]|nr:hypothetical protein [Bacteroidota bacterium]